MFQAFIGEPFYTDIARDRKISTIQMIGNAGGLVGNVNLSTISAQTIEIVNCQKSISSWEFWVARSIFMRDVKYFFF